MLFNSFAYAVFLPLVCIAYFVTPHRYRWAVLLAFSCYFYMSWSARLIVLIAFTTLVSWSCAMILQRLKDKGDDRFLKPVLTLGIGLCMASLFFFKYFNFFSENITGVMALLGFSVNPVTLRLILPVGISFYTFQTVSYIVDVYRGSMRAEKHLGYYALYVSFFPQLVAGPIERADRLLPQLRRQHSFSQSSFSGGLRRIMMGMFKKVVIADFLATYVNNVYNDLPGKGGLTIIAASVLFGIEIYCDFSGYSEIAIGSAQLLGINLMENFDSPYLARSVQEFWRRWHISLSTWFQSYVYIPLGGSRCSRLKHLRNLVITFLLSGLWHGASWTFALWGLYHGLLLCAETFYMPYVNRLQGKWQNSGKGVLLTALRTLYTYGAVTFGWIFFRANSLADLKYIFANLAHGMNPLRIMEYLSFAGMSRRAAVLAFLLIAALLIYDRLAVYVKNPLRIICGAKPVWRYIFYYIVSFGVIAAVCARPIGAVAEFIYFQF